MAHEKGKGVIGLKPFGAGTTFGIKPREIHGKVDPRAHVLVKEMLKEPRISAIIPGVNIPEQLDGKRERVVRKRTSRKRPKTSRPWRSARAITTPR